MTSLFERGLVPLFDGGFSLNFCTRRVGKDEVARFQIAGNSAAIAVKEKATPSAERKR